MSRTTTVQVRQGLVATLKTIKTANSYNTELPDDHFYAWSNQQMHVSQRDSDYPKAFLRLLGGEPVLGVQESEDETLTYVFLVVQKRLANADDLETLSENIIEDTKRALRLDRSLGGVAQTAKLVGYSMDVGVFEKEAATVCIIEVELFNNN